MKNFGEELQKVRDERRLLFECIAGSRAYGTDIPDSDKDIRGVYVVPLSVRVAQQFSIGNPWGIKDGEISDDKQDMKYFELEKFFFLLTKCNPTVIDFLFMPQDCIISSLPVWDRVIAGNKLFLSKMASRAFQGYAYDQIKKARGQNKWINNPQPKEPPRREDFCWVIFADQFAEHYQDMLVGVGDPRIGLLEWRKNNMPFRPVKVSDLKDFDLSGYHVASLEHTPHTYRLYHYDLLPSDISRGVFRNGQLVCESIPKEDEWVRFTGLLIYDPNAYERAKRSHKGYWTWIKERSEKRWIDQERGKLDYDAKNLSHCVRLMLSGENLLRHGSPLVRLEGKTLDFVRNVRAGKYSYEEIMSFVDEKMEELKVLTDISDLPDKPNYEGIRDLYLEILQTFDHCAL